MASGSSRSGEDFSFLWLLARITLRQDDERSLLRIAMNPITFKCPTWMIGVLIVGAVALLGTVLLIPGFGWPPAIAWIFAGVAISLIVYALTLLPSRLVISDEGVCQSLIFTKSRLQWDDMVEWRHCDGGAEFESGELAALTRNRWHSMEFWIKDKSGRKHHFKRWLVFGSRSKQFADILRERGIAGG